MPITITLNGKPYALDAALSVAELLAQMDITPAQAAVEINRAIVPRGQHGAHRLAAGDVVEIVRFIGGG